MNFNGIFVFQQRNVERLNCAPPMPIAALENAVTISVVYWKDNDVVEVGYNTHTWMACPN